MKTLLALWRGELLLADAFWTWAVTVGLVLNLTTTALFVALMVNDHPWEALVVGHAISVPYNLVAVVGVWRSASRYGGPAFHAALARGASLLLMGALSVI